jgi:FKBP-type peptidyl-prolyl cis-trans isomerase FkpA
MMQRRWWITTSLLMMGTTGCGEIAFSPPKPKDIPVKTAPAIESPPSDLQAPPTQSPKSPMVMVELNGGKFPTLPPGAGPMGEQPPVDFTTTSSGLKYRILRPGSDRMAKSTSNAKVHYHGWTDNGNVFDSSYNRGEPTQFMLNQVIAGWTEGMQLVGEGGMIELEIPSDLGYGARGAGPDIPGNSTLHFLVELLSFTEP